MVHEVGLWMDRIVRQASGYQRHVEADKLVGRHHSGSVVEHLHQTILHAKLREQTTRLPSELCGFSFDEPTFVSTSRRVRRRLPQEAVDNASNRLHRMRASHSAASPGIPSAEKMSGSMLPMPVVAFRCRRHCSRGVLEAHTESWLMA